MTQNQENIASMFEATLKFLDQNNNTWSGNVAFVEAVTEARTGTNAIRAAAATQEHSTVGVTAQKAQRRDELETQTLVIANHLTAFASKSGDSNLFAKANVNRSGLDSMQDADVVQFAQEIFKLAKGQGTALAPYGITDEQLTQFATATTTYADSVTGSRSASATRSSATQSIAEMIRQTRSIFRNQIDKMAYAFASTAPDFYAGYLAARVIFNRAATHTSVKAPNPPTPSPLPSVTA